MTRLRVTDRSTDEPLQPEPGTGGHPIVLPAATPSSARGRIPFEVVVAGWRFELEVEDADLADLREQATSGREAVVRHGPTEVRAIIPGRVVSVAVEAGEAVTAGQRLLAVEAMKMENELRAPRDGTVERVVVAVGETVELGDPLVVLR
jgi:biotin carboxyl carrier protein